MKEQSEADVEKYLVRRVRETGGELRKVKWIGRKNAPDRFVMRDGVDLFLPGPGPEHLHYPKLSVWVEVKKPGRAATFPATAHERAQAREHERMRKMGQTVYVIDSFADVDALVASD